MCVCDCSLCAQPEHHAKDILRLLLDKSSLFELQAQQGQGENGALSLFFTGTNTISAL